MRYGLCLLTLLFAFQVGCSGKSESSIVAHFGDEVIQVDEFRRMYHMSGIDNDDLPARDDKAELAQKRQVLDELITQRLLLDQARQQGIKIDVDRLQEYLKTMRHGYEPKAFKEQLEHRGLTVRDWEQIQQERFLITEWIRRTVMPTIRITAADVKAYYQDHREDFVTPERVRALQIVVPTRAEAEQIKERLAAGEDFATLAEKLSRGPESVQGGDLGYFARDETLPLFAETCFSLAVGETSDVVASDYGFHIFKVVDKQRQRKKSLAEVEGEIRERLRDERARKTTEKYVDALRKGLDIRINNKVLMEVQ